MPTSSQQNSANSASISASIGGPLTPRPISNPKVVTITPAKNGFVVQMQKVQEYGQEYAVATSIVDVTKVIADYFAA